MGILGRASLRFQTTMVLVLGAGLLFGVCLFADRPAGLRLRIGINLGVYIVPEVENGVGTSSGRIAVTPLRRGVALLCHESVVRRRILVSAGDVFSLGKYYGNGVDDINR